MGILGENTMARRPDCHPFVRGTEIEAEERDRMHEAEAKEQGGKIL